MTRLTIAAALAAGMPIFAACAQEAPSLMSPIPYAGKAAPAEKAKGGRNKVSAGRGVEFRLGRDNGADTAVDPTKTASVATPAASSAAPRVRPRVKATARKGTIGLPESTPDVVAHESQGSPGSYDTIIARYALTYGVPVPLAHAVIRVESNYRAGARGSAGEIGLMQIKPATARMMGYGGSVKGLFDPETNVRYGMKYLAMAHDLGRGDTCGTILRYNAGHAARRMNPVSAAYCAKVKRHLAGG